MTTVLIVEDDDDLQRMLGVFLTRKGYEVCHAPNGVEALHKASCAQPDLIVLDLMMPLAAGDTVLGFIRSTDALKQIPVLVVSAHPRGAELAEQLEADDFLPKPLDMRTFASRVDMLLQPQI